GDARLGNVHRLCDRQAVVSQRLANRVPALSEVRVLALEERVVRRLRRVHQHGLRLTERRRQLVEFIRLHTHAFTSRLTSSRSTSTSFGASMARRPPPNLLPL